MDENLIPALDNAVGQVIAPSVPMTTLCPVEAITSCLMYGLNPLGIVAKDVFADAVTVPAVQDTLATPPRLQRVNVSDDDVVTESVSISFGGKTSFSIAVKSFLVIASLLIYCSLLPSANGINRKMIPNITLCIER